MGSNGDTYVFPPNTSGAWLFDDDSSWEFDFEEFLTFVMVRADFHAFDVDGNGRLDPKELFIGDAAAWPFRGSAQKRARRSVQKAVEASSEQGLDLEAYATVIGTPSAYSL